MKNMKKVLAVMTAVSAMAASTSAFAAIDVAFDVENFSATYDVETNKFAVTLTDYTAAKDMTLLILDKDVADETNVQDGEIRYIDQGTAFANAGLKLDEAATQLAPGTYPVKLGYDAGDDGFLIAEADLVIAATPTGNTVTLKWGDLNGDGYADGNDAIIDMLAGLNAATEENIVGSTATVALTAGVDSFTITGAPEDYNTLVWGDLNGDGYADGNDAIIDMLAGLNAATEETICNGTISTTAGVTSINIDLTNKTVEVVK